MDMVKQSMLSLALAGSLTAAQFTETIKDYFPKNTPQSLNIEKKNIRKLKYQELTKTQLLEQKKYLDIMLEVNKKTFEDLFPALEVSLQKWVKQDNDNVLKVLDILQEAFDVRLKQYQNLKSILKNTNAPKEYINQIEQMRLLSTQAKNEIKSYRMKVDILLEARDVFNTLKKEQTDFALSDYWLPTIEDSDNLLLVSLADIDNIDYERIDEIENILNQILQSDKISIVSIG